MKSIPRINKRESLLLLGHKGLIGSALLKQLKNRNYKNIITVEKNKLDLLNFSKLENLLKEKKHIEYGRNAKINSDNFTWDKVIENYKQIL